MAVRTTAGAVRAIAEVDDDTDLTPFIEAANSLTTDICAPVVTYDSVKLELIERWLSAHFHCIFAPQSNYVGVGVVRDKTDSKVDLNLMQTRYGQAAMLLDTAGGLAIWNRAIDPDSRLVRRICSVTWLGTDPYLIDEIE